MPELVIGDYTTFGCFHDCGIQVGDVDFPACDLCCSVKGGLVKDRGGTQ